MTLYSVIPCVVRIHEGAKKGEREVMRIGRNSLVFLSGMLIALLLVGSVSANGIRYVDGTITDEETGDPVSNAAVTIINDDTGYTVTTTSLDDGSYRHTIDGYSGQGVTVNAEKDGKTGTGTGTMDYSGTTINIALTGIDIPEFPTIAIPIISIFGIMFFMFRQREKKQ